MASAVMLPPVQTVLKACEDSLAKYGVRVLREVAGTALHVLEYEHRENTLAVLGFTDELKFVRHPDPAVVALIRAHAILATC